MKGERNVYAIAARFRNSAGSFGGSKKVKNKKARRQGKLSLKINHAG